MRLTRPLFAIALVAGVLLVATIAAAVTARVSKPGQAKTTRLAASAHASHSRHATLRARSAAKATAVPAPAQTGMVVTVDPETGQLSMPTAEELATLGVAQDPSLDESDAGLVQVTHPNGAVSIDLQGRFQEYSVVRIAPNGRKVLECVPTRRDAARLMLTPVNAPALEDK